MLALKNTEIKLASANRQIQILQEQNLKFQHQVNESIAKSENLDRELSTQKEILKQMELTKKEYIARLKKELDTIEVRYQHLMNENCMIGEDFRSRARENLLYAKDLEYKIEQLNQEIVGLKEKLDGKDEEIVEWERKQRCFEMTIEEYLTCYDIMRIDRDEQKKMAEEAKTQADALRQEVIDTKENYEAIERRRNEGRVSVGVQVMMQQKKPAIASATNSASGSLGSSQRDKSGPGRRVGAGPSRTGPGAKPPAGGG